MIRELQPLGICAAKSSRPMTCLTHSSTSLIADSKTW